MARMDRYNNTTPNNRNASNQNKKPKRKKKNKALRITLFILLFLFLFAVGAGGFYLVNTFGKIKTHKIDNSDNAVGVDEEFKKKLGEVDGSEDIINIALLGIDKQEKDDPGRSDSTMIVSIDKKDKKIKMISVMRDSYVKIDGHGRDKLNHAHAYGGPQLTIKTLNQNFGLNIKHFVSVDFGNMADIVNALGGIDINIKADELSEKNPYNINFYIREISGIKKVKNPPTVTKTGMQHLNGIQAVAYSRIRSTGDGDFDRTERQREVLTQLFNKIKSAGVLKLPGIANKLMEYVSTSMDSGQILALGTDVLKSGLNIEQERFPQDGYCQGKMINGTWYLQYDETATKNQIFDYIFKDVKPAPKK